MCGAIGASEMSAMSHELEQSDLTRTPDRVRALVARLQAEYQRVQDALGASV
jgi:HPt (histidine-containing phosphotransfer) domain-containing protein